MVEERTDCTQLTLSDGGPRRYFSAFPQDQHLALDDRYVAKIDESRCLHSGLTKSVAELPSFDVHFIGPRSATSPATLGGMEGSPKSSVP